MFNLRFGHRPHNSRPHNSRPHASVGTDERRAKLRELEALLEEIRSPRPTKLDLARLLAEAAEGDLSLARAEGVADRVLQSCPSFAGHN